MFKLLLGAMLLVAVLARPEPVASLHKNKGVNGDDGKNEGHSSKHGSSGHRGDSSSGSGSHGHGHGHGHGNGSKDCDDKGGNKHSGSHGDGQPSHGGSGYNGGHGGHHQSNYHGAHGHGK